jgi:hypothetical protein
LPIDDKVILRAVSTGLGGPLRLARARQQSGGGPQAWSKHYEGTTPGQNMNLASDGTTTCVSTPGYSRCTGE